MPEAPEQQGHEGHGHGLPAGPSADRLLGGSRSSRRRVTVALTAILAPLTVLLIGAMFVLWPSGSYQELSLDNPYGTAEGFSMVNSTVTDTLPRDCTGQTGVLDTSQGTTTQMPDGTELSCIYAVVDVDDSADLPADSHEQAYVEIPPDITASMDVEPGDRLRVIILNGLSEIDGYEEAVFVDFQRTVPVALLAGLYALVVLAVARWRGLRSIIGLVLSFGVIFGFMIPALLEGGPPLWVGLVGCCLIMVVVLYFAHGFSLRTTTALLGTLLGLGLTALLALWGTEAAYLVGLGEEYSYILASVVPEVRLSGIVLCGLLIAGLGVLNDVTITQSSAVWELQAANPRTSSRELFAAGMRIGRDHIASTVYTIAFAYAGAAMPALMVISLYDRSLLETLTSGEMVEEVVRILIGSIGLVLAIPITTGIAVVVAKAVAQDDAHPVPSPDDDIQAPRPSGPSRS
ncbi:YibE/F family protein [Citricoccus sp. NR2]|uniref:YibE/F family protein n=1 Tax=Citricoccus sp. NR2 TaxID=3004095 RepID=UPI0022DE7B17|nr:YibE/F family protein [Citricoccus sp. NR2]WBL18820.1 YibE/F family protein [Citricoccus sp. NR2]